MGPEKSLIFSPSFKRDFRIKGHDLTVGSLGPRNAVQISNGLKDLSAESIRNRFLGSKKEFSTQELAYLTQLDGINHYAIGIEEQKEPKRGLATIRMVRDKIEPLVAEVAIAIIDDYQKIGLGSLLMNMVVLAASERKIESLSFTYLPQNEGIQKLIKKIGTPRRGETTKDFEQLFLDLKDLELKKIKVKLAPFLQSTGTSQIEI